VIPNTTVQNSSKLRVAILTGLETGSALDAFAALARHPEIEVAGILFDSERPSVGRRLRNLRRNIKREGVGYIGFRIVEGIRELLDLIARSIVPHSEVEDTLRRAFPDRPFNLSDFERLFGIRIIDAGNLNSASAAALLRELGVDLGVVLGTRVLKRSTFAIPRLGCLNVHKGKVPEYRGLPPGFWELYDGQSSAGVTIHFVDDGLDTGDIVGADTVPIHPCDCVESLQFKLDTLAQQLVVQAVSAVARGTVTRAKQPPWLEKARTNPTRAQRRALEERRMRSVKAGPRTSCAKTALYLLVYFSGFIHVLRRVRRLLGIHRGCIVLYHRVNDQTDDTLTIGLQRFAEHVTILKHAYVPVDSVALVRKVKLGERIPRDTVAVHFDDCYRDVLTHAAPILKQAGMPASVFISTGFIGTQRVFSHDSETCPASLDNLNADDILTLAGEGWVVGSHTVNHANLGAASDDEVRFEVGQSRKDLEAILGKPVSLFSYPFGGRQHTRPGVAEIVCEAGYAAMFSAYGGYVHSRDDVYNIQRIGASGHFRPLDLIMEVEGISFASIKQRLFGWLRKAGLHGTMSERESSGSY